jgi:hydroxymethylpyrimidine pyrophosphatase-like HAD family hydrolase
MRFRCLATDYDGTLVEKGPVTESARQALRRLADSGRRLILATGREVPDLKQIFPGLELFDRIVAENGAVLYTPATGESQLLVEPPPATFIAELERQGVKALFIGRVIVATRDEYLARVERAIAESGLPLEITLNKTALMVLPPGVDKATGLTAALADLKISPSETVGVGDAENDAALLATCGCGVAVANALPKLKAMADWVTPSPAGQGIVELVEQLLAHDSVPS